MTHALRTSVARLPRLPSLDYFGIRRYFVTVCTWRRT